MKRIATVAVSVMMVAALVLGVSTAMAAKPSQTGGGKPPEVIENSNGFPSGAHFNLNIHGKDWETCQATCDGGGSLFIPEYGDATIQYVTNKKSKVGNLTVLDCCAGFDGPNDVAKVQLPYEPEGYYVFGRIHGKPGHGASGNASSIILYPNVVVQACYDDPANPDPWFGNWTSCDDALLALGLIVGPNLYVAEPEAYVRFDPGATKGKGKSKATDITRLFTYTGWVVDERLDTHSGTDPASCALDPDGAITICDVPVADYDGDGTSDPDRDYNNDGAEDNLDIEAWLSDQAALDPPMAWYFAPEDNMWILNIADLVVTEQGLVNDGTKLLQIRFYPVATTEFTP